MSNSNLRKHPIASPTVSAGAGHRGGADWKFALLGGLATQSAPRIFTAAELHRFAQDYRPGASASTVRTVCDMLVSAGALRRVSSGLFLNRRAVPPAELTEVAAHIRSGAVISLHSVLGECGFLNNPSALVVAVLPTSSTKRPNLGDVETSSGNTFRFFGLAEKFFPLTSQERWEMLQPGRPCEMFRPEAALLQWLHLASMQRSTLTMPPLDVDMEQLDQELLDRLAERWGSGRQFKDWLTRAQIANFGEETERGRSPAPVAPTQDALDKSAAARARLMSRRATTR
ncbi:MAG: hypothetical protein ACRDIC_24365 [bacterium]